MTRDWTKIFLGALVCLFVVEHIAIVYDATVHSPQTLDPNPPCHLVKP